MRSEATKSQPKKAALVKPTFKQHSPTKQVKKKTTPPKKVVLKKTALKTVNKKKVTKHDNRNEESEDSDLSVPKGDTNKAETSKSPVSTRSNSPAKKNKNEHKEKKVTIKKSADTAVKKKLQIIKKIPAPDSKSNDSGDEIKYKINSEHIKAKKSKLVKNKTSKLASIPGSNSRKSLTTSKVEKHDTDSTIGDKQNNEKNKNTDEIKQSIVIEESPLRLVENEKVACDSLTPETVDKKTVSSPSTSGDVLSKDPTPQKPKTENERPPKFFTSSRSPRIVDVDLKNCKTTKTNVSLMDKFLSMKLPETKSSCIVDFNAGDSSSTTPKEPEIDVYTFTDYKVDSPKSILSDFRNPIGKNVGRVRPIARVKGTIIDKNRVDIDKKKYSPHRPIEEVVKQLKAGKRAEEARLLALSDNKLESSNSSTTTSSVSGDTTGSPESIVVPESEKSNNVVSKSYKMVARKSNIPGTTTSGTLLEASSDNSGPSKDSKPSKSNAKKTKSQQSKKTSNVKKLKEKIKKSTVKYKISDDDIEHSTFSINTSSTSHAYSSSDESFTESNFYTKECSESDNSVNKKFEKKRMKGKKICDSERKSTSKDLEALSPDSLVDLKESSSLVGEEKPSKRRLKLLSMWTGPKKHRMASLNALAKVHCLYENESRTHSELGLMKTIGGCLPMASKPLPPKKKTLKPDKHESTSESEYEKKSNFKESSEEDTPQPSTRNLRVVPGSRGSGKYWDHKSSTSSSEESEADCRKLLPSVDKRKPISKPVSSTKTDAEKIPVKMKKTAGVPVKKKRNRNEVVMDLKDMVVQKRMASLNATAILAASYEKRSPKSSKDETTTSDSNSDKDETYAKRSKNGVGSGVKTEAGIKMDECKKEGECSPPKQKVEVIVNQEADVTITGVYSTHHEGFCTVSGLKYRISSTSHTQTTATASAEKEGCSHEDGSRYTPLSALSSMQPPPADPTAPPPPQHPHPHPGHEHRAGLSGLGRRPGCSSAFSAPAPPPPPPTHQHHEPGKLPGDSAHSYHVAPPPLSAIGYYQPAGPLIKEGGGAEGRALARYHPAPPPHYHHPHPHPPVLQHYGSPYYAADLCYGRYYQRPPHTGYMPPPAAQPDAQMVGVAGEPYPPPPPQYYAGAPCYHNSPQRLPYLEYRGCPCPVNTCPKNVHIGPATGKPPNSGGPADAAPAAGAPPGGAFRAKARATRGPEPETNITNGKDPPAGPEPPGAGAAHGRYRPPPHPPHAAPPPFSGVSPKREHYPDACDEFRVATDGLTAEALGPPSPARGSAGACVPQPPAPHPAHPAHPPPPPRRARLGKDMVRKTLVGDDTAAYLLSPPPPPPPRPTLPAAPTHAETDDDVLVLSSPDVECAPIDLSSDETERRDPRDRLVADVKKENEGPEGGVAVRKPPATDAHALREHNSPCAPVATAASAAAAEPTKPPEPPKSQPTKRRYSRPRLEIEPSLEIADARPTNGIGEHVKLQKRRKLVSEVETAAALDRAAESDKKKSSPPKLKRGPKPETELKRCNKRKSSSGTEAPPMKRLELEAPKVSETFDARLQNPAAAAAAVCSKPKNRSALLLDKLIRKNSVDRMDALGSDYELDPAELFLPRAPNALSSSNGPKKVLNINNNVVGETVPSGARPTEPQPRRLMADMLLAKIAAGKLSQNKSNAKPCGKVTVEKVTSKTLSEKISLKNRLFETIKSKPPTEKPSKKLLSGKKASAKISAGTCRLSSENLIKKPIAENPAAGVMEEKMLLKPDTDKVEVRPKVDGTESSENKSKLSGTDVLKPVDKSPKLLPPKDVAKPTDKSPKLLPPKEIAKPTDKSAKLLCPKADVRPAEGFARPAAGAACGAVRRRRSGGRRRARLARAGAGGADELPAPRAQPRWSNGWLWEGEAFASKVYLNNDVRQDGTRRCYGGMVHADGDRLRRGDCVLLRAAARRGPEQPFVARVEHMWENPDDGEMMVSLVWYYRPEHTELGRQAGDAPDEVFASRHRDANSVACIEDKCHVLTFNEYCRYRKKLKASEEGIRIGPSIVPPVAASDMASGLTPNDCRLPLNVSPELVLFCRKIYDFRSKKIQVPNSK